MSLQLAAQHLSHQGRGGDSTLVHMSPREVKSLNDLAMAHGGQLSINPQTGLPEAGFLESILPMVAGAALTATGVGAPMAALMVGGGMTLMTGSLQKGLMAGLGAYGGANLGSGLLASGTDAAVASAPEVAAAQQNAAAQMEKFYNPTSGTLGEGGIEAIQKASADAASAQAAARTAAAPDFMGKIQAMGKGIGSLGQEGGLSNLYQNLGGSPMSLLKSVGSAAAPAIGAAMTPEKKEATAGDADMGQRYGFSMNPVGGQPQQAQPGQNPPGTPQTTTPFPTPDPYGREQRYFAPAYTKLTPEEAKAKYGYAEGGATRSLMDGVPLNQNSVYPGSYTNQAMYGNNSAQPFSQEVVGGSTDAAMNPMTEQGYADGGDTSSAAYNLGDYSDGGRLLRGPGNGTSDDIPAMIGKKQPARLADGEFVVPARIVSELGNGSTEAGARQLYAMMDRIQASRRKTVGKDKVAFDAKSRKHLPA